MHTIAGVPRISLRCTALPPVPAARQVGPAADSDRPQAEAAKARSEPDRVLPLTAPAAILAIEKRGAGETSPCSPVMAPPSGGVLTSPWLDERDLHRGRTAALGRCGCNLARLACRNAKQDRPGCGRAKVDPAELGATEGGGPQRTRTRSLQRARCSSRRDGRAPLVPGSI
jgi:hypothetical protein